MSEYLLNPYKLSVETCRTRQYEKNCTKAYLHREDCLCFKKLCFQQAFRCYRIYPITSTVKVRKPFGPFKNVLWGFLHSIVREKMGHKFFFTGVIAFFFKNLCFQQAFRCYRIYPITSTVKVRKPFGPFKNVLWGFLHSIVWEKMGHKIFFTGVIAFFFKNLCFQQAFRCYRIYPITSTVKIRKSFGPFKNVPWILSHPIVREK